jgi:hypothetical protein
LFNGVIASEPLNGERSNLPKVRNGPFNGIGSSERSLPRRPERGSQRHQVSMDTNNPVIQLCIEGTRAEFEHRTEDARTLYQQAWEARQDAYEACVAAHYVARFQESLAESLRWNQIALDCAETVKDERVKEFYPSLYLNLGQVHEKLGHRAEAQRYYALAAALGVIHQPD